MKLAIILFLVALSITLTVSAPLIKVFCSGSPVYRGRIDSIVNPGVVSGHVHKVAGGNNFGPALASQSPIEIHDEMFASTCTTCSIDKVDMSAYWHPDLYYRWDNGSLSLVPRGGLTVYYLARSGSGAQANPQWKAFPRGFRMLSGNPFRRTFNSSNVNERAINFACLSEPGGPQTNGFPLNRFCKNGLRLQVHFPQCWDGVNLDSPNHASHVAFPLERPDGGNCPASHPVRIPNLFFEAFYSVSKFPHGDGTKRFVLANGDETGYGFHGDFLNGWNVTVLQQVLDDPSCDSENTNAGNDVRKCAPVSAFVQSGGPCTLTKKIPLTENLGLANLINTLPGCNAITGNNSVPVVCSSPTSATEKAPEAVRFHLKSESLNKYFSCPDDNSVSPKASLSNFTGLTYNEVFVATPYSADGFVSLVNEGPNNQFLSPNGPTSSNLMCNRGSASDWEAYKFVDQPNGKVAIIAKRNGKYLTVNADGTISPSSTSVGSAQLFSRVVPSGGSVF